MGSEMCIRDRLPHAQKCPLGVKVQHKGNLALPTIPGDATHTGAFRIILEPSQVTALPRNAAIAKEHCQVALGSAFPRKELPVAMQRHLVAEAPGHIAQHSLALGTTLELAILQHQVRAQFSVQEQPVTHKG